MSRPATTIGFHLHKLSVKSPSLGAAHTSRVRNLYRRCLHCVLRHSSLRNHFAKRELMERMRQHFEVYRYHTNEEDLEDVILWSEYLLRISYARPGQRKHLPWAEMGIAWRRNVPPPVHVLENHPANTRILPHYQDNVFGVPDTWRADGAVEGKSGVSTMGVRQLLGAGEVMWRNTKKVFKKLDETDDRMWGIPTRKAAKLSMYQREDTRKRRDAKVDKFVDNWAPR